MLDHYIDDTEEQRAAEFHANLAAALTSADVGLDKIAADVGVTDDEQDLIDNITAVDGDDPEDEEYQADNGFDKLYGRDENGEVYAKGSAYSLTDWDETDSCIGYADPKAVIALETVHVDSLESKWYRQQMLLKDRMDELRLHLSEPRFANQGIYRDFALTLNNLLNGNLGEVVRMESFTKTPSKTNLTIAMEEVTKAQGAMAVGGAVLGIGIIYKIIQWLLKALGRNGDACSAITGGVASINNKTTKVIDMGQHIKEVNLGNQETAAYLKGQMLGNTDNAVKGKKGASISLYDVIKGAQASEYATKVAEANWQISSPAISSPFVKAMVADKTINAAWFTELGNISKGALALNQKLKQQFEVLKNATAANQVDTASKISNGDYGFLAGFNKLNMGGQVNPANPVEACGQITNLYTTYTAPSEQLTIPYPGLDYKFDFISVDAFNGFDDRFLTDLQNLSKEIETVSNNIKSSADAKEREARLKVFSDLSQNYRNLVAVIRTIVAIRNATGKFVVVLNGDLDKTIKTLGLFESVMSSVGNSIKNGATNLTNKVKGVK